MEPHARLEIRVHYDLASSLCYVAHRVLERLAPELDELEIDLRWTPLDLALLLGWRRGDRLPEARLANARRVARELDVPLRTPPVWLDSRRAMAASLLLEAGPREATWRERVFSAAFEEGRDIGATVEFERLAAELELDFGREQIEEQLEQLEVRTLGARDEMVSGVPTFMLDEWPLGGIQQEDTMRSILRRYAKKKRRSSAQ